MRARSKKVEEPEATPATERSAALQSEAR
jgi:hypothetical protein